MSWQSFVATATSDQIAAAEAEIVRALEGLDAKKARDRVALAGEARNAADLVVRRMSLNLTQSDTAALVLRVIAHVGGLGFLAELVYERKDLSEIAVNPDGSVWIMPKGGQHFERLEIAPGAQEVQGTPSGIDNTVMIAPGAQEVQRAVEALLAPLGRAVNEAAPSVDAKLPRDTQGGFGGARVKIIHPVVASGRGYPSINVRLFEPKPVTPQQLAAWNVAPQSAIDMLLDAVSARARVLIVGGTATGKTTLLSALTHGIPPAARVVKIEDPEEIWLSHKNVVTLEARPAAPGSSVPPYTIRNGVDDAMRMAPQWLVVGEVRTGDAAMSLFRAQMSDHPGLSTFHAEGPDEAVHRIGVIMFADAQIRIEAAKSIFAQAVDLVVQIGWTAQSEKRRAILGAWQTDGLAGGNVKFNTLWQPGQAEPQPYKSRRQDA